MFTILMNSAAIIGVKFYGATPDDLADKLEVFYGGDSGSIIVSSGDETFEYYYNHFLGQKNQMLSEAEENNKETEPVGPIK